MRVLATAVAIAGLVLCGVGCGGQQPGTNDENPAGGGNGLTPEPAQPGQQPPPGAAVGNGQSDALPGGTNSSGLDALPPTDVGGEESSGFQPSSSFPPSSREKTSPGESNDAVPFEPAPSATDPPSSESEEDPGSSPQDSSDSLPQFE